MRPTHSARRSATLIAAALLAIATISLTPAWSVPGTGQTKTISGTVRSPNGSPVAGASLSYDNVRCADHVSIAGVNDDSDTILTAGNGTFSFPAFATQCYDLEIAGKQLALGGKLQMYTSVVAGTQGLQVTAFEPINVNLKVNGVADGVQVQTLAPAEVVGMQMWLPVDSGTTDPAGEVTLEVFPGQKYALQVYRNGDYYTQYVGTGPSTPSFTSGPGTFTAPSTGPFAHTVTLRKSQPLIASITGANAGASLSATALTSFTTTGSATTTTVDPTTATLRGLTPGLNHVSLNGTNGTDDVSAEAFDVQIQDQVSSPATVSLSAQVRGTALVDSDFEIETSGILQVGKKLKAHVSVAGPAASLIDQPSTRIRYYWHSGPYIGIGTGPMDLFGTGDEVTVSANIAQHDMGIIVAIISAPGQATTEALGYSFISTRLITAMGSLPFGTIGNLAPGESPVPTRVPRITGKTTVGSTLTANPGTWTQNPTGYKYQWNRGVTPILGATSAKYKATTADRGASLTVTVTPVKAGHLALPVTSAPTATITAAPSTSSAKTTAKVSAKLAKKKVARGKRAKVTVTVKSAGKAARGKVTVRFGKQRLTKRLNAKGRAVFTSAKLTKRGKVVVRVNYAGSATVKKGKAKNLTVAVR